MRHCLALLSGGLDSILAIRLMQQQGIGVEAVNFKTVFTCCQDQSAQAARDLNVPLTVIGQDADYLDLIKTPKFGYGRGANPCVDCRIYMFEKAKHYMEQVGADFIISGEVVGQRPMSQKRRDLERISYHSELEDLLLRPLSAKLLPPTLPERKKWVDRSQLYDFHGRSRKGLIELAKRFGMEDIPSPSTGCALTETRFSKKVFDLNLRQPTSGLWDYGLLTIGRHFRLNAEVKAIVGRHESENLQLEYLHQLPDATSSALLRPREFSGPAVLLIGPMEKETLAFAGGLIMRYGSAQDLSSEATIEVLGREGTLFLAPTACRSAQSAVPITEC
ncbi:MAG: hypothetical protein MK165_01840 [Pirellulaceae bacterium]|nr:hypothetical protein [Pirellulaceae bacterium]